MHNKKWFSLMLVVMMLVCFGGSLSAVYAQSPAAVEANKLFQEQKWEAAAKAFDAVTKAEPKNAPAWFKLGTSLQLTGKLDAAIPAYLKAVEIGKIPLAMFNLGCVYSRLNQKDESLKWLDQAVKAGFSNEDKLKTDADLAAVRDDERFKPIVQQAHLLAKPCDRPECRQFDFWIGEWDVFNPAGQKVADSSIQLILNDCVILENYSTRPMGPYEGKSFNVYDQVEKKWKQTWVDVTGSILELSGEFKDGVMDLRGEAKPQPGQTTRLLNQITWKKLPDGTVNQVWNQSSDGGKTWTKAFDGIYKLKPEKK